MVFYMLWLHIHFPVSFLKRKGKTYGFKDSTNTGNNISYDKNVNMISDANKANYNPK